MTGSDNKTYIR